MILCIRTSVILEFFNFWEKHYNLAESWKQQYLFKSNDIGMPQRSMVDYFTRNIFIYLICTSKTKSNMNTSSSSNSSQLLQHKYIYVEFNEDVNASFKFITHFWSTNQWYIFPVVLHLAASADSSLGHVPST